MISDGSDHLGLSLGDIELTGANGRKNHRWHSGTSGISQERGSESGSENEARSPVIRIQDIEDEEDKAPERGRPSLYDNL